MSSTPFSVEGSSPEDPPRSSSHPVEAKGEEEVNRETPDGSGTQSPPAEQPSARYSFPRGARRELAVPDMVWGKVVGYPWWPGQILDPAHASLMASRRRKHGRLLVAYFGDGTFAWCAPQQLKHFLPSFEDMENQSPADVFARAVGAAVAEAARRAEAGLVCRCVPEGLRGGVAFQHLENSGVRKGVAISTDDDASFRPSAFAAGELVEFVRALGVDPNGEFGPLDVAVARAHLTAYWRSKGFASLCAFYELRGVLETHGAIEEQTISIPGVNGSSRLDSIPIKEVKRPDPMDWIPMDEDRLSDFVPQKLGGRTTSISSRSRQKDSSVRQRNRKKPPPLSVKNSVSFEHPDDKVYGRKRKSSVASPFGISGSNARTIESEKEMSDLLDNSIVKSPSSTPYQSFKVGEFIRRFATRRTDSSPILKTNGAALQKMEVGDKPDSGNVGERKESMEGKQQDGTSSDEALGEPGEIKYSRRQKA